LHLSAFGPPAPVGGSSGAWMGYSIFLSSLAPLLLCAVGVATAWGVAQVLLKPPDWWICRRKARCPVFLPIWALLTLRFCWQGFIQSEISIAHTSSESWLVLRALRKDVVDQVVTLGTKLADEGRDFNELIQSVPASCYANNLTSGPMTKIIGVVNHATNSIYSDVDRLNAALNILPQKMKSMELVEGLSGTVLVVVPWVPMLLVFTATVASIIIAFLSFYSSRVDTVERALVALRRYGPKAFGCIICVTTLWSAVDLHLGVTVSKYCLEVDANTVGVIEHLHRSSCNWTAPDTDCRRGEDIVGAMKYYILGEGHNPFEEIVTSIHDGVTTLVQVQNATAWIQSLAGHVCPKLQELQVQQMNGDTNQATVKMKELLAAKSVWPTYNLFMHSVMCDNMPRQMSKAVLFSSMVGLVMVPVLAFTLYVDLKRMKANWDNPESEESESEDELLEEAEKVAPEYSSATYTHVTKTTYSSHKAGSHRTFLA